MRAAIRPETALPAEVARLVIVARAEGFHFVDRLVTDWEHGENRFARSGEVFLCAYRGSSLVGFGGLNRDPYSGVPNEGRIRHVYLEPRCRGLGMGRALVSELIERARSEFTRLRLTTQQAAPFYEHLGFQPVSEIRATHALELRRPAG